MQGIITTVLIFLCCSTSFAAVDDFCQEYEMSFGRAVTVRKTGESEFGVYYRSCLNGEYIEDLQAIYTMSNFPTVESIERVIEGTVDKKLHDEPLIAQQNQITYIFQQDWVMQTQEHNCAGKEWQFGRAIETGYRGIDDSGYQVWKVKIGVCNGDQIEFVAEYYWQRNKPGTEDYTDYQIMEVMFGPSNPNNPYGERVHQEIWHEVVEKGRVYYVFESDWKKEESRQKVAAMDAIRALLLN